jgi:hypothetical protein
MCKKRKSYFHNMTVFALSGTILLMSMRARHMMSDANFLKEGIKLLIIASPICLHSDYFPTKLTFNIGLIVKKNLINIRTLLEQVNPRKFTIIIDKAYII